MCRPWPTKRRSGRATRARSAFRHTLATKFAHAATHSRAASVHAPDMSELRYLGTEGWARIASVEPSDALARFRRLAAVQGGVVDRAQLLACGLSASSIKRLIAKGWLIPLLPGVYALGPTALTMRGRLVGPLLYAGFGSALSHPTAAHLWRMLSKDSPVVHLATRRRRRSIRGIAIHRPREIDCAVHDGLPVTIPARTLMDISALAARSVEIGHRTALRSN